MAVRENSQQRPVAVQLRGRWLRVAAILDLCSVDEEWWQERPVVRMYYRVSTQDGRSLTLFRDMLDGAWYRQNP